MRHPLFVVLLVCGASCSGADLNTIADQPTCASCAIRIEPIHQIGAPDGYGSLTGRPVSIRQDGRGRYWVEVLDAFPLLYDSTGTFVQQLGQPGDGPGEYRDLAIRALLPGDSALVRSRGRYLVFGPDLLPARTVQVSPRWELSQLAVLRWPDNVLGLSTSYDQQSQISTTHIARYDFSDSIATVIDSVAKISAESREPSAWASSLRMLGEPGPNSIWVSNRNQYKLVRVFEDGTVGDSVIRRPDWFPGGESLRLGGPGERAAPHMMNSWEDEKGSLWVLVSYPRSDTEQAWEGAQSGAREVRVASLPAPYKLHETMIEVLDLDSRSIRARHVFDGYVFGRLAGNRIATYTETEMGIPIITIHRMQLSEPQEVSRSMK